MAIGDKIQNWKAKDGQDNTQLEAEIDGVLTKHSISCISISRFTCFKIVTPRNTANTTL